MSTIYTELFGGYPSGSFLTEDTNWSHLWSGSGASATITNGSGVNNNTTSSADAYSWGAGGFSSLGSWGEITLLNALTTAGTIGPLICGSSPGGSPTMYALNLSFGGNDFQLRRINAGSYTSIGTTGSYTPAAGDVWALAFDGTSTLTVYKNYAQVYQTTDGTPLSVAGPAGIWWYNGATVTMVSGARGGLGSYPGAPSASRLPLALFQPRRNVLFPI